MRPARGPGAMLLQEIFDFQVFCTAFWGCFDFKILIIRDEIWLVFTQNGENLGLWVIQTSVMFDYLKACKQLSSSSYRETSSQHLAE